MQKSNENASQSETPTCVGCISLCFGSSCFARGNEQNLQLIEKFLNERGLEASIELRGTRCVENCLRGPRVEICGTVCEQANEQKLLALLNEKFGAAQ